MGWGLAGFLGPGCSPTAVDGSPSAEANESRQGDFLRTERIRMVEDQLQSPKDGRRPVRDPAVIAAMKHVPRHEFVPESQRRRAYEDRPLSIGHEQTISQPYMVAIMTELLELSPGDRVLEIGTGSGYQAAVLSQLAAKVFSIEIVAPLGERAKATLAAQGCDNVSTRIGDGYQGWPEAAPFDAIVVTAAPDHVPQPLIDQLESGGRMVIPVGPRQKTQKLRVIEKQGDGSVIDKQVMAVRFVPFTGDR